MLNQDAGAVLRYALKRKQKQIARAVSGCHSDLFINNDENEKVQMTETRIYVGLNDAESREQKFETERYLDLLKYICRNYQVAFSVDIEEGGYFHEDGEYTEETSLVLILINADPDIVEEIAKDLCTFFRQESVLITEDQVYGRFITKNGLFKEEDREERQTD